MNSVDANIRHEVPKTEGHVVSYFKRIYEL